MSGLDFDAEDLELEEEDVDRVLRVLEREAQKEFKAQPVRWKKRDRHGFVIPKRPNKNLWKTYGMPSAPTTKQHQRTEHPRCAPPTDVVASVNLTKGSETEVLRQELLEDGVDDEVDRTLEDTAVTCDASPESTAMNGRSETKCPHKTAENMLATQDPHCYGPVLRRSL